MEILEQADELIWDYPDFLLWRGELVLRFRPVFSSFKVDQGFLSGCHSQEFSFAGMSLVWGQYAVGGVGPLGVVIGHQPSGKDAAAIDGRVTRCEGGNGTCSDRLNA